ncbi:MAG TPA: PorV/PorQ family protein, partial [bacterium]|nr:PorV/PorQ family protein [bacterium]
MYYARIFLVALLGGVLLAGPALATRTTSAAFLKIGVGARAAGMGEAYVAQAQDASGLYWNPAGLARLDRKQFIFMHNDWFENINYEYLGYVHPLAGTALFGRTWDGALGGSLTYVDKGDLQRTTYSNPFGAGLGSFEAQDFAGAVSYAESYNDQLDLGGTLKLVYQEIDDVTATSVAVDFGAQYRGAYPGLTLGAALTNLGTKAKFEREDEDLPLAFRFGAAYEVPQFPLTVATDGVWLYDDEVSWRVGVEYDLNQYLALRAGYNSANDADDGFGGGFGITIDDLEINYAYVPYGDLGNTHRIDSVFRFGEIVPRPEPQAPPVTTRPQPPITTRPQPPVT